MTEIYCPFESLNTGTTDEPVYDRAITAEMERIFNKLRYTNGVFSSVGSALAVSANNSMTVTVGTGGAHIEGAMYFNSAPINLAIEAADASLNRIDRVVLQFNTSVSVRSIRALIRTGTAATNPVAPELRQESNLYEITLADIYVKKGATSIAASAITDQRLNSGLCGFVVAAVPSSVDTTGLFDQYQAALDEWLETVAAALDETLAGNLQNQITAIDTRLITEEDKVQPITQGGTGATTAADALKALLANKALSIAQGGTGATTAAGAWGNIVEEYDSGKWHVVKYANGELEQFYRGTGLTLKPSTSWGYSYYTSNYTQTFPVAFKSVESIRGTIDGTVTCGVDIRNLTLTQVVYVFTSYGHSWDTISPVNVSLYARGKWK